jgi:hypothetical protein
LKGDLDSPVTAGKKCPLIWVVLHDTNDSTPFKKYFAWWIWEEMSSLNGWRMNTETVIDLFCNKYRIDDAESSCGFK